MHLITINRFRYNRANIDVHNTKLVSFKLYARGAVVATLFLPAAHLLVLLLMTESLWIYFPTKFQIIKQLATQSSCFLEMAIIHFHFPKCYL